MFILSLIWSLINYNLLLLFCSWWRCGSVCPVEFWLVPICSVSTQSSSCRWTRRSPRGPALSVTSLPLLNCSLLMGKEQETRSDSSQCCSTKFLLTNSSSRVIFVGWSLGIVCKLAGCCCAQSLYVIIVRALNVLHDTRGCVSVPALKLYPKILHPVQWLVDLLTVWFAYCNMVRIQTIVILRLKKATLLYYLITATSQNTQSVVDTAVISVCMFKIYLLISQQT